MIATLNVKINAQAPEIALPCFASFNKSPTTLRIIDVPKKIGNWEVKEVYVKVNYPGNTSIEKQAVKANGVWQVTVDGSKVSGEIEDGYGIYASGIDENGTPVNGFCLGRGMVKILGDYEEVDGVGYRLTLRDEIPFAPKEGDVAWFEEDGQYKLFDGEEWKQLGGEAKVPVAKEDEAGVIKATPGFLKVSYSGDIVELNASEAQHAIEADEAKHASSIDVATKDKIGGIKATDGFLELNEDGDIVSIQASHAQSSYEAQVANEAIYARKVDDETEGLSEYAKKEYVDDALDSKADKPVVATDEEDFFNGAMPVITQSGEIKYNQEITLGAFVDEIDGLWNGLDSKADKSELDEKADKASIEQEHDKIRKGGIAIIDENEQIKYNPEITLESIEQEMDNKINTQVKSNPRLFEGEYEDGTTFSFNVYCEQQPG